MQVPNLLKGPISCRARLVRMETRQATAYILNETKSLLDQYKMNTMNLVREKGTTYGLGACTTNRTYVCGVEVPTWGRYDAT